MATRAPPARKSGVRSPGGSTGSYEGDSPAPGALPPSILSAYAPAWYTTCTLVSQHSECQLRALYSTSLATLTAHEPYQPPLRLRGVLLPLRETTSEPCLGHHDARSCPTLPWARVHTLVCRQHLFGEYSAARRAPTPRLYYRRRGRRWSA
jgi:hypothetical protein